MKKNTICCLAAVAVTFTLLLVSGCLKPNGTVKSESNPSGQKGTAKLALKFTPGDSATYKVIQETIRQATWEGSEARRPAGFKGGQSGSTIETVFEQYIQSTTNNGNVIAKITIKKLIYKTKISDKTIMDFDSSKKESGKNPLSNLIGQSYTIELTPTGQVAKVVDVNGALKAISVTPNRMVNQLISVGMIKHRHTITALPTGEKQEYNIGDNWEVVKNVSFDQMGTKSFGKIYTLEEIQKTGKNRTAVIRMNAVPSVKYAKELYKEQVSPPFPFDSTDTYTGSLKLNLAKGSIEEYDEKLISQWVILDPKTTNNEKPDVIKMSATQFYRIEKAD